MEKRTIKKIKNDFRQWSGGFSPESEHHISVYINFASGAGIDSENLKKMLCDWMKSTDPELDLPRNERIKPLSS